MSEAASTMAATVYEHLRGEQESYEWIWTNENVYRAYLWLQESIRQEHIERLAS